jgi:hypothetical protein
MSHVDHFINRLQVFGIKIRPQQYMSVWQTSALIFDPPHKSGHIPKIRLLFSTFISPDSRCLNTNAIMAESLNGPSPRVSDTYSGEYGFIVNVRKNFGEPIWLDMAKHLLATADQ